MTGVTYGLKAKMLRAEWAQGCSPQPGLSGPQGILCPQMAPPGGLLSVQMESHPLLLCCPLDALAPPRAVLAVISGPPFPPSLSQLYWGVIDK